MNIKKKTYSDGAVYEGEWMEGKPHGEGKRTWSDGAVYEGEWRKGKPYGLGKGTFADGTVYSGGVFQGSCHCFLRECPDNCVNAP